MPIRNGYGLQYMVLWLLFFHNYADFPAVDLRILAAVSVFWLLVWVLEYTRSSSVSLSRCYLRWLALLRAAL